MSGATSSPAVPTFDLNPPAPANPLQDYIDHLSTLHGYTSALPPPADWPYAANPVGTETTQSAGRPSPADDRVAFYSASGVPIMESDLARTHAQLAAAREVAPAMVLGMVGDAPGGGSQSNLLRVYHGTPHLFAPTEANPLGAFDLSKIGSGEGAQVYGHGLYVAENPTVAQSYRESVRAEPTFDHSATGGPAAAGRPETIQWLTEVMGDDPSLAHVSDQAIEDAATHVVDHLGDGGVPAQAMKRVPGSLDSPMGETAVRGALEHMRDVKVNYGGPTVGGAPFNAEDPVHQAAVAVHKAGGDHDAAIGAIDERLGEILPQDMSLPGMQAYARVVQPEIDQLMAQKRIIDDQRDALPKYKPAGHMYEADISAPKEDFLHWDKKFTEQSPQVQDALRQLGVAPEGTPGGFNDPLGSFMYQRLTARAGNLPDSFAHQNRMLGDPAAASERLRAAGIPGIRYLDQGSRAQGGGSHNLVLFNPDVINIIKRYGIAALLGGGGAGALAQGGQASQ